MPTFDEAYARYYPPLRAALRAAGINDLTVDVLDERHGDEYFTLHIEGLNGTDADNLTALLKVAAGEAEAAAVTRPTLWGPDEQTTLTAHHALAQALEAAGIAGLTPPQPARRAGGTVMHLRNLDGTAAVELAALLHAGLAEHFDTAGALGDALSTHGLDRQIVHGVRAFRITLGEISVPDSLAFGTALGAPPFLRKVTTDDHDLADGVDLSNRLAHAVAIAATGSMNVEYIPWCRGCENDPRVFLGALDLDAAQRLATALRTRPYRP